jgi:hypothetical protein
MNRDSFHDISKQETDRQIEDFRSMGVSANWLTAIGSEAS